MPGHILTRGEALAAGWTRSRIATALRSGRWVALVPGAYVERSVLAAGDERGRHLLLAEALLAVASPDLVLSHRTAAVAHGWPLLGPLPARPLLTRAPRSTADSGGRFVRVATLPAEDVVRQAGLPTTSPARTVIDVARHESLRSGMVVADAALRDGVYPAALQDVAVRQQSWPGARRISPVLNFANGLADGPLETLARLAFRDGGLPAPELQVPVRDLSGRLIGVVDFLWRAQRTVGEVDGMLKYTSPLDLRREKQREDDLRRLGLEVVRADWPDVTRRSALVCQRVRDAFALAELRFGLPTGFSFPPEQRLPRQMHT